MLPKRQLSLWAASMKWLRYWRRKSAIPGAHSADLNHKTMVILLLNNNFVSLSCVVAIIPQRFKINALSPSMIYPIRFSYPQKHLREKECSKYHGGENNYFSIRGKSVPGQWSVTCSVTFSWCCCPLRRIGPCLPWARQDPRVLLLRFWVACTAHMN